MCDHGKFAVASESLNIKNTQPGAGGMSGVRADRGKGRGTDGVAGGAAHVGQQFKVKIQKVKTQASTNIQKTFNKQHATSGGMSGVRAGRGKGRDGRSGGRAAHVGPTTLPKERNENGMSNDTFSHKQLRKRTTRDK